MVRVCGDCAGCNGDAGALILVHTTHYLLSVKPRRIMFCFLERTPGWPDMSLRKLSQN